MIGTLFRALASLVVFAIVVGLLNVIGFDLLALLAPFIKVIFAVVLLAVLAACGWYLFKLGYAHRPSRVDNIRQVRMAVWLALLAFFLVACALMRLEFATLLTMAVLGFVPTVTEKLAPLGIAAWKREQRRERGSTVYGRARFLVFDAELDGDLLAALDRVPGHGALLGFFESNQVPTFWHRVHTWMGMYHWDRAKAEMLCSRFGALVYRGPSHLLTIAPARSGKGACVIIPNLLTLRRSVICIDPKGENAAVTKRHRATMGPVYLLNPFNEHGMGTGRFNPLGTLDINSPNVVADAAGLAEALIISEGKEPFFTDSARDLVQALILHLVATKGKAATLPEMRRLLTLPSGEGDDDKFGLMIFDMTKSPHPFIAQPAGRFKNVDKTTLSIISTAIAQTKFLDDPSIVHVLSGHDFNMRDFKQSVATLYIILPSRYLTAYARFFRLIVVAALEQLTAVPGGQRVTFLLDEFAQLGHLSAVETALGLAAGYNVQLWPFLQDLNQLKDIYKTRWETFLANAGVVQWFAPNDMTTAEYLSKRLGNWTAATTSVTQGNLWTQVNAGFGPSKTRSEAGVTLQSPQELMAMDTSIPFDPVFVPPVRIDRPQVQILNVAGIDPPIRCLRAPYYASIFQCARKFRDDRTWSDLVSFDDKDGKPTYDENPFHRDPPSGTAAAA